MCTAEIRGRRKKGKAGADLRRRWWTGPPRRITAGLSQSPSRPRLRPSGNARVAVRTTWIRNGFVLQVVGFDPTRRPRIPPLANGLFSFVFIYFFPFWLFILPLKAGKLVGGHDAAVSCKEAGPSGAAL